MKHCCKNCYFLSKHHVFQENGDLKVAPNPWTQDERSDFSLLKESPMIFCMKGIWHLRYGEWKPWQVEVKVSENRKDSCFFVEYLEGLGFDAADELQRRRYETRQHRRNIFLTQIGLIITAVGLVANLVYQVLVDCKIVP